MRARSVVFNQTMRKTSPGLQFTKRLELEWEGRATVLSSGIKGFPKLIVASLDFT